MAKINLKTNKTYEYVKKDNNNYVILCVNKTDNTEKSNERPAKGYS